MKTYEIKKKEGLDFLVYEFEGDESGGGLKAIGSFRTLLEAEEFTRAKKYKDKLTRDVKSGKLEAEEMPF